MIFEVMYLSYIHISNTKMICISKILFNIRNNEAARGLSMPEVDFYANMTTNIVKHVKLNVHEHFIRQE